MKSQPTALSEKVSREYNGSDFVDWRLSDTLGSWLMTTIQQVLDKKGHDVLSVRPETSVFDAIRKMAERDVGSVVVIDDDGKLAGIFTERHYARKVFLEGRASPTTLVGDVMEKRVACARPEQTVDECMAVMTGKRVRHLPVLHLV